MGSLNQIDKKGSSETFGNVLQVAVVEQLIRFNWEIITQSRHNKVYQGGTIDGFRVTALDGTQHTRTESPHRSCKYCKRTELG